MEGVETAIARDGQLEGLFRAPVLDLEHEPVVGRVPEQPDTDAVVLAGGELAQGRGGLRDHGISTSLTLLALVRSAT